MLKRKLQQNMLWLSLLFPMVTVLSGCNTATDPTSLVVDSETPEDTVKIGALLPLSGDLGSSGRPQLNAMKLAVQEINEAGGVLGKELELVVADTKTNVETSIAEATKMVKEIGVAGILGPSASRNAIATAEQITSKNKIVQISAAATSPTITDLQDQDFLFRTVGSDALQGIAMAGIARSQKLEKVAILYLNDAYGQELADIFTAEFQARNGIITGAVGYQPGQKDFIQELKELASQETHALVLIGFPTEGKLILTQALKQKLFPQYVLSESLKSPALVKSIVKSLNFSALNGAFGTAIQSATTSPTYIHFHQAYESNFDELPFTSYLDTSYDATMLMALAIEKAGTTKDGVKIRNSLRQIANAPGVDVGPGEWKKAVNAIQSGQEIDYVGASGTCDFNNRGDIFHTTFGHWEVQDRDIHTVEVVMVR